MNVFFWELLNFRKLNPDKWVVVHCTHGYNRTGKGLSHGTAQHISEHVVSNAMPAKVSISSCKVNLVFENLHARSNTMQTGCCYLLLPQLLVIPCQYSAYAGARFCIWQLSDVFNGLNCGCHAEDLLQGAVTGCAGMPASSLWVPAGFMITNWLMRTRGMALAVALKTFAEHRPEGIYKEDYVRTLHKYYHEPL